MKMEKSIFNHFGHIAILITMVSVFGLTTSSAVAGEVPAKKVT